MNRKNVQLYASLAEIVSAVAIIISLLYVAYEFRRSETLSSNDVDMIIFERVSAANTMLIENGELAKILIQAASEPAAMSEVDRRRYLAYQHNFFDSWEIAWIYYQDGILDESTWEEWDRWFTEEANRRPVFGWTGNRHHFTGQAFRQHVEARIPGD